MTNIEFAEPITVMPSDFYKLVIKDANDVRHFWLPDGNYDGYDRPCKQKDK